MKKVVYLDYAATTPVAAPVAEAMSKCLTLEGNFGNPASRSHRYGWQAEEAVENSRREVADFINANNREIVWTSGATEANNLALKGVMERFETGHLITSTIEHKAILDTCKFLESSGYTVTYLEPDQQGLISVEQVLSAVREDTRLVSLMLVNNELGVYNPIAEIAAALKDLPAKDQFVLIHTDAAQAVGKSKLDVAELGVDLMSLSAHKMYGPKGIGVLYVRKDDKVKLEAQIHGGGHEQGMRSGTLATHQIVGFAKACEFVTGQIPEQLPRLAELKQRLWQGLEALGGVTLNGSYDNASCAHLNVCFAGVDGEILLASMAKLAVSSGSACNSASVEPSYVLQAIGVPRELAHAGIRFSLGYFTTEEDIDFAISEIGRILQLLRS